MTKTLRESGSTKEAQDYRDHASPPPPSSSLPPPSPSPSDCDYDRNFLNRVLEDAGRWAYGVILAEVWVLNDRETLLVRRGFWLDPLANDYGDNDKFARLLDPTRADYLKSTPYAPGCGLPGILWHEAEGGDTAHRPSRSLKRKSTATENGLRPSQRFGTSRQRKVEEPLSKTTTSRSERLSRTPPMVDQVLQHLYSSEKSNNNNNSTRNNRLVSFDDGIRFRNYSNIEVGRDICDEGNEYVEGAEPTSSSGRFFPSSDTTHHRNGFRARLSRDVAWREIGPIASDHDQPYNPILLYMESCGLGWAAGVPFHVGVTQGLVVYMARKTADVRKLASPANGAYLTQATLLIASAHSLRSLRLEVERERKQEAKRALHRARVKLQAVLRLGRHLDGSIVETSARMNHSQLHPDIERNGRGDSKAKNVLRKGQRAGKHVFRLLENEAENSYRKFWGANVQPPPPFTWEQTFVTFFGSLCTLLFLTTFNDGLVNTYGPEYSLVLGPFGAFTTLLYSLTSAPASQPRNAILGQFVSLMIAYGFGRSNLPAYMQSSFATAISIALLAKMGLTHPPAGAAAMIFSTGNQGLPQVATMLVGNVVAILCGTIFNNLSRKRQYPTFWAPGIGLIKDSVVIYCSSAGSDERKETVDNP